MNTTNKLLICSLLFFIINCTTEIFGQYFSGSPDIYPKKYINESIYFLSGHNELKTNNNYIYSRVWNSNLLYSDHLVSPIHMAGRDTLKISRFRKIAAGSIVGTFVGLGAGIIIGGLFYVNMENTHGDTISEKERQSMKDWEAGAFVVSHSVGSIVGVILISEYEHVNGSIPLGIIGGIGGSIGSMAIHLKWKNFGTLLIYLIAPSIFTAIGYNLYERSASENGGQSSLFIYKSGKFSINFPDYSINQNNKTNEIIYGIRLLNVSF